MTPFFCSLAYPLCELDLESLNGAWEKGACEWPGGPDRDMRQALGDRSECQRRSDEYRRHLLTELSLGDLRVVAAEVVRLQENGARTKIKGYLLLHVESSEAAREATAMKQLAGLARPGTGYAEQVIKQLAEKSGGVAPWKTAEVHRVASIALSAVPAGDRGLVHWEGSTALDRRLASLLVLRKDEVEVSRPYPLEATRPTPSYLVECSGSATAIVRLRPVEEEHVARLRTVWVDVLLAELLRRDVLADLAEDVRCVAKGESKRRNPWPGLGSKHRQWRTTEYWQPEADHPMEQGLAHRLRDALRTDQLVARIDAEIEDHSAAAALASSEATNGAVLLLTVVAAWVPVLLQASQFGLRASLDLYFGIAVTASAVVSVLAFLRLRNR